ncbi:MAG: hypothetical protein Q8916_14300 [Bacteroidota bacterium]|nr:hypothetical protein [Bacteroidota bacterium]MDP4231566.1 hypothetical protein [Bacteroidota bacterium]MDP4235761.1 hypothetical protein [Bacteroidota bacterium]
MADKHTDLDRLIDSALTKDRAKIPELPEQPDASLLSRLETRNTLSAAGGRIAKSAGTGFLSGATMKLVLGFLGATAIGAASFFLFFPASHEDVNPLPNSGTLTVPLDSVKLVKNDSIKGAIQTPKINSTLSSASHQKERSDTTTAKNTHRELHSNDLLPASSKEVKKDGIEVPIEGH